MDNFCNQVQYWSSPRVISLISIMLLSSWMTSSFANPMHKLLRVKRDDLEMGGMYFHEDYSGAPGSGGGVAGPVYLCGYAGSSPDDFTHQGTSDESHSHSSGNEKSRTSSSGYGHLGSGKSSASADTPKLLPSPKPSTSTVEVSASNLKPKSNEKTTATPDVASDKVKVDTGSQYYLRPHILHMPTNTDTKDKSSKETVLAE